MDRRRELRIAVKNPQRVLPRQLQQRQLLRQVGHLEFRQPMLARAEELAGAAKLKVEFRDLKAVGRTRHRLQPRLGVLRRRVGEQQTVRRMLTASNAAAELVELAEAETVGV